MTALPEGDAALRALFAFRPGAVPKASGEAPPVEVPSRAVPQDAPAIGVVPQAMGVPAMPRGRVLAPATAVVSTALHAALVVAFVAFTAPSLPQAELPAVEIDLIEPEAEPPAAAAAPEPEPTPAQPVTEVPPVEIDPPEVADMPLPPELVPPEPPVAETPPVEQAPQLAAVEQTPVVIEPPPDLAITLPAELTPPVRQPPPQVTPPRVEPPRREVRRPDPPVQRRPPPPRREVQREEARRAPPRRQAAAAPSAASQGRGVAASQSQRTSTPPPSYLARVLAQLHRAKPASAGQQGRAVIRFAITRSGAATGIALAGSSGNSAVDQAALAMVRRAGAFPPLPAEYGPSAMPLSVPVNFR